MGGFGSGRPGWRVPESALVRLNISQLYRAGLLLAGWSFELSDRGGGAVRVSVEPHRLDLRYPDGAIESVGLERLPRHVGGVIHYFSCPGCGKRVRSLYAARRYRCRHCLNLCWDVENEDSLTRMFRRSSKISSKLEGRLWNRTRARLEGELAALQGGLWKAVGQHFGADG